MAYLAIALVLIFVMWLIDKHNQWKRVAKIAAVLVLLGVLGIGGLYAWKIHKDREAEKAEAAARAAVKAQHDALVKDCLARIEHPDVFDQVACENDPSSPQTRPPVIVAEEPIPKPSVHHVRSTQDSDVDLVTTEYGSLVCGHVKPGEIVVLVRDEGLQIKVRTKSGQVGWAWGEDFEKVN